jgi:hypothetical protein
MLVTVLRIPCSREVSADCMDDLFTWITNVPIAFMTVTPLKLTKRATGEVSSHVCPYQPQRSARRRRKLNRST